MTDPVFSAPSSNFGLTNVGDWASPTFADIDGDGDLDAFIGNRLGDTLFFLNTPVSSAPNTPVFSQQGGDAPFGLINVRRFASPTLVDMDGDGDLDAFIGNKFGETWFFKNTGSASSAAFSVPVTDNPFNPFGFNPDGNAINPSFVDIDGDGDLDAFLGKDSKINNVVIGETWFYKNTGSASSAAFSTPVTNNPFGLTDVGKYANPTLVDIDGDGDLDAFIGDEVGEIRFFRNTGSASSAAFATPVSTPFGLTRMGEQASPTFVDIDRDGDLDAFIGYQAGDTKFFLNTAPGIKLTQTGGSTAVTEDGATDTYTVVLNTAPTADVTITLNNTNGQVTADVTTLTFTSANWNVAQTVTVSAVNDTVNEGKHSGVIQHNASSTDTNYNAIAIGTLSVAITDNELPAFPVNFLAPQSTPFGLSNVEHEASPTFVDIDGDGDLDAFIGNNAGNTLFFRNTPNSNAPHTPVFSQEGGTSPFGLIDVGSTASPTFVDIDGDGDLDAFIGNFENIGDNFVGNTLFFRNTGDASTPVFSQQGGTAPFGLGSVGTYASPTLVDIDGDGDLDAFIGDSTGNTVFFRNTASAGASTPAFSMEATNPFGLVQVGGYASPTLVDIDGDGDLDAFIGNSDGDTVFFRNTAGAGASTPVFSLEASNPFSLADVGNTANPTFADIDGDGDLDAFIGNMYGDTLFFLNAPPAPVTITDLNGDLSAWAGVGQTVLLDSASNATVTGSVWTSLTVGRTTPVSSDQFSFNASDFTVSDSDLQTDGNTFATFTNTGGVLTISFNSSATTALVQAVMRGVLYRNDTPAGDANIRFSLSDGSLATTADVTVTSDIIYVTNTTNIATIGVSDGISFSEAVAIAVADSTGSQTLVLGSAFATTGTTLLSNLAIGESLTINADAVASSTTLSGSTITLGAGSTLTITNASGTATVASALAGAGELIKAGAGTLKLTDTGNESGMSGGITVTAGKLQVSNDDALSSGALTLNGGTLQIEATTNTIDNAVVLGGGNDTVTVTNGPATMSGVITGTGALSKTGGQLLTLSGSNSYTGGTTIAGANGLSITDGTNLGTGAVTIKSDSNLVVTGSGVTLTNAITLVESASINNTNAVELSGVISGGALTKTGSGTLTLSGANSYTGATTVAAGKLTLIGGNSIADTSAVTVASSATLALAGGNETIGSLAGAGNVALSYKLTTGGDNNSTTFSGVISSTNSSGLTKAGVGTLTLSGANTYTGVTTVSAGTLALNGELSATGAVTVATGAILAGSGSIGTLGTSGAVTVQSGGTLAPGVSGPGTLTLNNGLTVAAGGIMSAEMFGTTVGTGYDQIKVYGTVTLAGATLSINLDGFTPTIGSSFTLIDNDGTSDAIVGTVKVGGVSLADNARFVLGGQDFTISYTGGDGNDLVLRAVLPNTAPTIAGVPGTAQAVTTGSAAALADFTVADVEQGATSLSVTLTATNGTLNGLTDADLNTAGTQFSGTAAALNTALAGATFTATAAGAASIVISVSDGIASAVTGTYALSASNPPAADPDPITDTDGASDATENAGPGLPPVGGGAAVAGDGNGDGVADSQQSGVTSTPFRASTTAVSNPGSTAPVYLTLVADAKDGKIDTTDGNTATLTNVRQLDAPANLPDTLKMPLGLLSFSASVGLNGAAGVGVSETFSLYVDASLGANAYFKQNASGTWVNLASAAYGGQIVTESGKTRLDFQLKDGGEFDSDGKIDGVITDPGGIGIVVPKDSDHDQFPDALEAANGLTVGIKDNNVFASSKFFAMQLYRDILYREGETAGVAYWQDRIDNGLSRAEAAVAFLDSPEFQGGTGAIARMYFGALGRMPDAPGMGFWMDQQQTGTSISQIAAAFVASTEFTAIYGSLSDTAFIEAQYQSMLGRSATGQEQTQWSTQMLAGTGRGELLMSLTESTEYKVASDTKLSVALDYLGLLGRPAEQAGFDWWVNQQDSGAPEITVVGGFIASPEFHDRFLP